MYMQAWCEHVAVFSLVMTGTMVARPDLASTRTAQHSSSCISSLGHLGGGQRHDGLRQLRLELVEDRAAQADGAVAHDARHLAAARVAALPDLVDDCAVSSPRHQVKTRFPDDQQGKGRLGCAGRNTFEPVSHVDSSLSEGKTQSRPETPAEGTKQRRRLCAPWYMRSAATIKKHAQSLLCAAFQMLSSAVGARPDTCAPQHPSMHMGQWVFSMRRSNRWAVQPARTLIHVLRGFRVRASHRRRLHLLQRERRVVHAAVHLPYLVHVRQDLQNTWALSVPCVCRNPYAVGLAIETHAICKSDNDANNALVQKSANSAASGMSGPCDERQDVYRCPQLTVSSIKTRSDI